MQSLWPTWLLDWWEDSQWSEGRAGAAHIVTARQVLWEGDREHTENWDGEGDFSWATNVSFGLQYKEGIKGSSVWALNVCYNIKHNSPEPNERKDFMSFLFYFFFAWSFCISSPHANFLQTGTFLDFYFACTQIFYFFAIFFGVILVVALDLGRIALVFLRCKVFFWRSYPDKGRRRRFGRCSRSPGETGLNGLRAAHNIHMFV